MIKLSLFAVQEIPAAIVTFVSLLIFIQTGTTPALSTFYSALLALPWVMKYWLGVRVRRNHRYRWPLILDELLLIILLLTGSAVMNPSSPVFSLLGSGKGIVIFVVLFLLSMTTAWHEVLANAYYHFTMRPIVRRFYDAPRMFVSQCLIIVTYGFLIILVSIMEVLTRSIYVSWSVAFMLAAGVVGLVFLWHLLMTWMDRDAIREVHQNRSNPPHVGADALMVQPITHLRSLWHGVFLMTILMLPQGLMFYTRVLFLLAPAKEGGLACSLQEVGFAHGVVGAIAFSIGMLISHKQVVRIRQKMFNLLHPSPFRRSTTFAPSVNVLRDNPMQFTVRCLPLFLSPVVYLIMTIYPPAMLWQLSIATFVAQVLFGYGLHRMLIMLHLPALNGLRLPVVAASMIIPMALSGCLVDVMGFHRFFLFDTLTIILPFLVAQIIKQHKSTII